MSENQQDTPLDIYEKVLALSKDSSVDMEEQIISIIDAELVRMANGDEERLLKLRQQQWKINGELRRYKDPIARYNKMQELFWVGVNKFKNTLKDF